MSDRKIRINTFTNEQLLSIVCAMRKAEIWYSNMNMESQKRETVKLADELERIWSKNRSKTSGVTK
jgi:hypothetical protein